MRNFDRVYTYVKKLSRDINRLHDIDPDIHVAFGPKGIRFSGFCIMDRGADMYILLRLPVNFDITPIHKTDINVLLCHEYCHYLYALTSTGKERHESIELYVNDHTAKKIDEHRTWRQTCTLAQDLGLWNKPFFTRLKDCEYTSEITY